ncbi:hypothetical protein EDB85DRAFT_2213973, partial [Lactarius pseudohatsudake]
TQCPPPLGLPGPPFSPIRAATFTRKGGIRALFPTTPRRPRPFPLVRAAPFARTEGVRRQAALPLHVGSGPTPSLLSVPPRTRGREHARPATPLPSPFARKGCTRACRPRYPFPLGRAAPYAWQGGTRSPAHPSPFVRKAGARGHAASLPHCPRHLPFPPRTRGMEVREGTPQPFPSPLGRATPYARARHPAPLPHSCGRGCTRAPGPPIPIAPGPSPLGHPARTRGHGAPERTRVHEGTTPPAAPYALARYHPGPPFPIRAEGGAPS